MDIKIYPLQVFNRLNLTQDSIYFLLRKISIPASIGLISGTLFNVVDSYYAGQHIDALALSGMQYTFPLYLLLIAFGNGMGSGFGALFGELLGKKDFKEANILMGNGIVLVFTMSLALFGFIYFASPSIIAWISEGVEAQEHGTNYIRVIAWGIPISMLSFLANAILSVQGDTKSFRNSLMIAFVINLFLDPLFIIYFDGGIKGLAWATVLVQAMVSSYLWFKVFRSELFQSLPKIEWHITQARQLAILRQGVPTTINMVTMSSQIFIMNHFIQVTAGDEGVAGLGAAFRVEQLVLIPTLALNFGVMALVGQNYGAQNIERIKETFKKAIILGLIVIGMGSFFIFFFGGHIVSFFNDAPAVVHFGQLYLKFAAFVIPSYVLTNVSTAVMQALQKPWTPLFISVFRRIFVLIIALYLSTFYFEWGIEGLLWTFVLLPWIGVIFFVAFALRSIKKSHSTKTLKELT